MPTRLERSYQTTARRVRNRVERFAVARFGAGQYRDADLERFVAEVVPVVLAGQRQIAALTNAYLTRLLASQIPRVHRVTYGNVEYSRGVDPAQVYARPYVEVRTKISEGLTFDAAVSAGTARLVDIARTDMQLAKTHTARRVMQANDVKRYRRVPTGSITCALCHVASTQLYRTGDLMPIHPGCDCGVEPVLGDFDADAHLEATHEAIGERFGQDAVSRSAVDYRKALIVREHGEIGPVLTLREHHFRGPSAA